MKLGIVGLPNVGKTTLFNALTGSQAETGSYTNAAAKPNLGSAKVPDERLDWLAEYYHPKKYSPASIDFVDVAGIGHGGGKGNALLQTIRQTDALVHVVRCFENEELFLDAADPCRDAEDLDTELILADMEVVERRLDKAKRPPRAARKNISGKPRCAKRCWPTCPMGRAPGPSPSPRRTRTSSRTADCSPSSP